MSNQYQRSIQPKFNRDLRKMKPMIVRYRSWNPLREMEMLRHQVDAMFDEMPRAAAPVQTTWTPPVELKDAGEQFVLRVLLPGIKAEDVDIQVTKDQVAIAGTANPAEDEQQRSLGSEFRYGAFRRVIGLPTEVQNDQVTADLKDGVLTLMLPKVEAARVVKLNLAELAGMKADVQPESSEAIAA